jgi:hypothetical protein
MRALDRPQRVPLALLAAPLLLLLSGCRVIGDIFKAGVGVGIFFVLVALAVIGGLAALFGRRK